VRVSPQRRFLSLRPSSGIFWMLLSAVFFLLGAARFGELGIAHIASRYRVMQSWGRSRQDHAKRGRPVWASPDCCVGLEG
jgi:hypothetical protein